jgi:hypothetical protein
MFEKFRGKTAGATVAALLAALGVGGIAAAQNGSSAPPAQTQAPSGAQRSPAAGEVPGQESNAPENSAADPDNVQQGDASTAATAGTTTPDVPTAGDTPDTGSAPDVPTAGDTPDTGSAAEAPGSEAPGNDGPTGHADEPGNAAADHQATGVE